MKHIAISDLKKYYQTGDKVIKALDGINLSIDQGELVAIMGTSGGGKSTLLNLIAALDAFDEGEITVNSIKLSTLKSNQRAFFRKENVGFIFQDYSLLNSLTFYENIELSLAIKGDSPRTYATKIQRVASALNIQEELSKYPYQTSGGQQQRCACARALVSEPNLIIADEPTGALDSQSAKDLLRLLIQINQSLNVTTIVVSHDPLVASYFDRIIYLKDGQIFKELIKTNEDQKSFYQLIMQTIASDNEEEI